MSNTMGLEDNNKLDLAFSELTNTLSIEDINKLELAFNELNSIKYNFFLEKLKDNGFSYIYRHKLLALDFTLDDIRYLKKIGVTKLTDRLRIEFPETIRVVFSVHNVGEKNEYYEKIVEDDDKYLSNPN